MHVVVHIGPHKTGSSSVQRALRTHQEMLLKRGVLHYSADPKPVHCLAALFSSDKALLHPELRRHFSGPDAARTWSEACWQDFEARVAHPDICLSVISSEFFSTLADTAGFIARLRRTFARITVVAYVRDPADLFLSGMQQRIQGGNCLRDLRTPLDYIYPYARLLPVFAKAVGPENLVVRNLVGAAPDKADVVSDFFGQLQAFAALPPVRSVRVNESLSGAAIAWLLLNNETQNRKQFSAVRHRVLDLLRKSPDIAALPRLRYDDTPFGTLVRSRNRETCDWLNRTFLQGQGQLPLADPEVAATDAGTLHREMGNWMTSYLTPEALRCIAQTLTA